MSRTKSLDPAIRITVTIPGAFHREALLLAKREGVSLSAFVAAAVKECLIRIRGMAEDGE